MPGLVGIITNRPHQESERLVRVMLGSMQHESYYASGAYSAPEIGVYGGWVALEKSFSAGQVFLNESKDIALLFSGECYIDCRPLAELGRRHQVGFGHGDWLVHAYEEQGDEFFGNLNGLFSGLLIDKRRKRAFLFNDRYGFDRVYIAETKEGLYFASEAKALLCVRPELRSFDYEGVGDFLTFGCTIKNRTLFRGIGLLPGGSVWTCENAVTRKQRYFEPSTWEAQSTLSLTEFEEAFTATFKRVLPRYFEGNTRLGISLTAGLDTRMIMACRPETSINPICYTYDGLRGETLDTRLAARVARACDLDHHVLRLGQDFFSDFISHVERTAFLTDGCFGATGAHEIYFNFQARELSSVRLTGVFGGEVFRGVSTFKRTALDRALLHPELRRVIRNNTREDPSPRGHFTTFAAFSEIPWSIHGSVAACRSRVTFRTPYLDNELVALGYRTPKALRKSSIPVQRVVMSNNARLSHIPTDMGIAFCSSDIGSLPNRCFSKLMFKIDYFANDGMPDWFSAFDSTLDGLGSSLHVIGQHKYLRYRRWFRRELSECVKEALEHPFVTQSDLWNSSFVRQLADAHIQGRRNYVREINAVLTLGAIERLLLHDAPTRVETPVLAAV